jgi:putative tryptophan/tyrosine transport system substrate-binding protein
MRRREFLGVLGSAATWPLTARAQQGMPVVGLVSPQSAGPAATRIAGFNKGLSEQGYVDGENVKIEYRWAEGHYERMPGLVAELVHRPVDVLVAPTQDAALAAKTVPMSIPLVFNIGGDPVRFGLVASMNRPGGNATGMSMFTAELGSKRLGLLHELVPRVTTVGALINPNNVNAENQSAELRDAARALGLQLHFQRVGSDGDFDAAFESLAHDGARAMISAADPFLASRRDRLVALAAKHAIPAMWEWPDFVEGGGLMSYGPSIVDSYRQIGSYTGRILKGEKTEDMPVVQPVKFELAINLKTALSLDIVVPPTLLARADEVIE